MHDERLPVEPEEDDDRTEGAQETDRVSRDEAHQARIERGRALMEEQDDQVRKDGLGGLIPYHNKQALVGYYTAVFSLLPCFPIGLFAAYKGYQGFQAYKARPAIGGHVHSWIAMIVGGLFGLMWLGFTLLSLLPIFLG